MGWAATYIERLQRGETVRFRPHGTSMQPRIMSGQLCTVVPVVGPLALDEIVLCRVRGAEYLHLVKAVRGDQEVLIGNNRGRLNGWIPVSAVFGRLQSVG